MPEGAVYVGRPSRWGNPFKVGMLAQAGASRTLIRDAETAVLYYRIWLRNGEGCIDLHGPDQRIIIPPSLDDIRRELAGKDLVCWCPPDAPCHADLLLELANGGVS